jgi:predicted transposase YdaD
LFNWTFRQRQHAAGLLRAALPPAWVAHVDFRTLRLENTAFVNRALRRRHSDLVFSVRVRGEKVYFYVLVEHQSRVERLMVVRMGIYVMRLYDEMLRDRPGLAKIPPIVPVLVHHSKKGWTAKTAFQDVIAIDEALRADLWRYIPHYEMRVVDLHEPSPANLEPSALTAYGKLVLSVLGAAGDETRLRRAFAELGSELVEVLRGSDAAAALEALLRYIAATFHRLDGDRIAEMVESGAGPEAQEVIVTWLDEIEQRGRKQGRNEGRKDGRNEGRAEILLKQLGARFGAVPAAVRAKIQAAGDATLSRWAVQVLTALSIDDALADGPKATPARKPAAARRR